MGPDVRDGLAGRTEALGALRVMPDRRVSVEPRIVDEERARALSPALRHHFSRHFPCPDGHIAALQRRMIASP
jgi:hypothetical protein